MQERDRELILRSRRVTSSAGRAPRNLSAARVSAPSYHVKGPRSMILPRSCDRIVSGDFDLTCHGTPFAAAETTVENRLIDRWRNKRDKTRPGNLQKPRHRARATLGQTPADKTPRSALAAERFAGHGFSAELSAHTTSGRPGCAVSYKEIAAELGRREKSIDAACSGCCKLRADGRTEE